MPSKSSKPPLIEICVGSVDDACSAELAGADRLELCSALELGGLTPSLGLIEQVISAVNLPVVVMIRPRAGGFCYSESEFRGMLRDAELAIAAGATGIVFGVLDDDLAIDREKTKQLVDLADSCETVFHRAFDFVSDRRESLDLLVEIGITRLLTTGGKATVVEGIEFLKQLNQQAAERVEIMPGGGVMAENAEQLVLQTGCYQLHCGAATSADSLFTKQAAISLCDLPRLSQGELRVVDVEKVAKLKETLLRYETSLHSNP